MSSAAQRPKAVHASGATLNKSQLDETLQELADILKTLRAKRDALAPGDPGVTRLQARIDRVQYGYSQLVECFHGEHTT